MYLRKMHIDFFCPMRASYHASIYDWKVQLRGQEAINAGFNCSRVHQRGKPPPSRHWRWSSWNELVIWIKAYIHT